jgi:nitroreductase
LSGLPAGTAPDELLTLLGSRRSGPDRDGTAPDDVQLAAILAAATTVPDHGGLRPWRFVVVRAEGRQRFGDALVAGLVGERGPDLPGSVLAKMRGKALAAPAQIVLIASPRAGSNVPVWEQVASASCTGFAVVLAATALGLGAVWKSAAVLHTDPVRAFFGAGADEQLLGWINVGTAVGEGVADRPVPELGELVTVVEAGPAEPFVAPEG